MTDRERDVKSAWAIIQMCERQVSPTYGNTDIRFHIAEEIASLLAEIRKLKAGARSCTSRHG